MRHTISFNGISKVVMGILGAGPSTSWVEVRPDVIHGRVGWLGSVTLPRENIVSVEEVSRIPVAFGLGIHGGFGTWAFNGALSGAVKITLHSPGRGRVLFIPIRPRTVYFSLETPVEFVHEAAQGSR